MCTEKKCCISPGDTCYQRANRPFSLCRPLQPDGSCVDTADWLCPDSPRAKHPIGQSATSAKIASEAVKLQPEVKKDPVVIASAPAAYGTPKRKPKALVVGLEATAGAIMLLLVVLLIARCAAQRHERLKARGRNPSKSASAKTRHNALAGEDDEEDDDDIIGDDEAPRRTKKPTPSRQAEPEPEPEPAPPVVEEAPPVVSVVDDDEAELMRKVASLLDDVPFPEAK